MTDPSGGFEASLGIFAEIRDGIHALRRQWTAKPEVIAAPFTKTVTSGSTGNLLIPIGEPIAGHRWFVREIIVGGTLASSTPSGTAWVAVSGSNPDPAALPFAIVRDFTLAAYVLPQNVFYGRGEMIVTHPEKLYVVIVSPSATTQYVATAWIEDVELGQGVWTP